MTENLPIPAAETGSYPVRAGNVVRPLVDGEPAFRRICEAIEAATQSVWVTVTFMWPSFRMPDGRGSALDVLDRAAARGVDVRILFWRPDEASAWRLRNAFWGSPEQVAELEARRSGVRIRWDRAEPGFCQHQKSWLLDVGFEGETAFVGGINLNPHSLVAPGHHGGGGQNHDVYVEVTGPSVVDVHHNFVQRWNEASEREASDGRWGGGSEVDLPFPAQIPAAKGSALVQIQRTVHPGRYTEGHPTPGGSAYDIASGERSLFDQYCAAIRAARRSIYLENQYVAVPEIVDGLLGALQRGVEVVLLVPSEPDSLERYLSGDPQAFFERWDALGAYEHFTLAGLAGLTAEGRRAPVYVHAKVMLVDDAWATLGSCNLHRFSLFGSAEMNATFWCPETVRALRCELLQEHLGQDPTGLDDRAALRLFREVARENRTRLDAGDPHWQGLAFELDPARYGRG